MPRIRRANELKDGERLKRALFHESGRQLVPSGTIIDHSLVTNLKHCGINTIFEVSDDDNIFEFVSSRRNVYKSISSVTHQDQISCPLIDQNGKILLGKNDAIDILKQAYLKKTGMEEVLVRKRSSELKEWQVEKFKLLSALDEAINFLETMPLISQARSRPEASSPAPAETRPRPGGL